MDSFLRKRTFEGVARRYGAKASMKLRARADKQVDTELALIAKLGLAGYFLIMWDIVEFCRRHGILVQGPGSRPPLAISSFALYGFPESHAASFALIAYASAWLKFHYLPGFTAAILNNQPMGFYSAAVLVKDAQRHGLRIMPVDVLRSDWNCTLEREPDESLTLRLGLRYVRGLRSTVAAEIERVRSLRPFGSIEELARRVPSLSQADLSTFAETGALNSLGDAVHRRDALWQVERAVRRAGPLLSELEDDEEQTSPLHPMNPEERMIADYAGIGVTVGRHRWRTADPGSSA